MLNFILQIPVGALLGCITSIIILLAIPRMFRMTGGILQRNLFFSAC